ncbi:hypothetical protein C5167_033161 [Papaver somniferum]|uniref:Uncharacterized protein n=1 Tax=Papaver somniferum TaxID=3469 RepID=A0A4Y7KB54_PAPSO|nr:hypothetical protein C5167_033161 [Papaver somniferum]
METKFSSDNNHEQGIDHLLVKHSKYLTVEELWDAAVNLKYSEESLDDLKKDLDSMKKLDDALCQYSKNSLDATFELNASRIRVYDSVPSDLYGSVFTANQQCDMQNYADLKQDPTHLHDKEAVELLVKLRSELDEIEAKAYIESEKQGYLSQLDIVIKRVTMWDDMLKEENRVRENIDVIAPVPVSVATVVENSPVASRTPGSIGRSALISGNAPISERTRSKKLKT